MGRDRGEIQGRKLSETNRKQALAPRGFTLLPNPNGTAPGFHGNVGEALVIALPGPPRELRPMFSAASCPCLSQRFGGPAEGEILWGTALMVPESNLEEGLRACQRPGITWGTRVDEDRIAFSLRGGSAADRAGLFEELAKLALAVEDTTRRDAPRAASHRGAPGSPGHAARRPNRARVGSSGST